MDVQASSGINVNLTNNQQEEIKPEKKKIEPKKNGNKKLALALGGLAAIGAATVGIAYGIKTGKIKGLNKIAKQAENIADDVATAAKSVADDVATN